MAAQTPVAEAPTAVPDANNDAAENKAPPAGTIPKPVSGPTGSPPTIIGRDHAGAAKEVAPAEPSPTAEDSSIEQQIKQAQEQQALIKAQLEKKKQEKQSLLAMNQISAVNDGAAQQPLPEAPSANQQKAEAMAQQQMAAEQQALAQAQAQADAIQKQQAEAQKAQDNQKQAEAIYATQ